MTKPTGSANVVKGNKGKGAVRPKLWSSRFKPHVPFLELLRREEEG